MRRALGASATRVIREQLAESLLLACAGGGAGIVLSLWALDLLLQLAPASLPRRAEVGVDWTVLAFGIAVSLLTALVFGLVPAVQASNPAIQQVLRGTGRTSGGRGHARVRRALIMLECAIAVVLLVSGALLVRSFWHLQRVDPGFSAGGVTADGCGSAAERPRTRPVFHAAGTRACVRDLLGRLRPFGEAVALATMSRCRARRSGTFTVEGWPEDATEVATAQGTFVTSDYFATLGIPLVRGRLLDSRDDEAHPPGNPGQRNHGANVLAQPGALLASGSAPSAAVGCGGRTARHGSRL